MCRTVYTVFYLRQVIHFIMIKKMLQTRDASQQLQHGKGIQYIYSGKIREKEKIQRLKVIKLQHSHFALE